MITIPRDQSAAAQGLSITDAGRNLSGVKLIAAILRQPETRPIGPPFDRIDIAVQAYEA